MAAPKGNGRNAGHAAPAKTFTKSTVDFIALTTTTNEARASSQAIAAHLGIKHANLFGQIKKHRSDFEVLGLIRFQTGLIDGRGRPEKFAMFNEDQSLLELTFSRNTDRVRHLKVKLVKAFGEARRAATMRQTEYLPGYHAMHDQIKVLANGSPNEGFVHMNCNKALNKFAGLESGQRSSAPLQKQAMLIVGQMMAARAMQSAHNPYDGYQRMKQSLLALTAITMLEIAQ